MEKLNLFFGMNGMGKSSVIQSMLLLRQSYWSSKSKALVGLKVSGELIKLGTSADILCQNAEEDTIRFIVGFSDSRRLDVKYFNEIHTPTSVLKVFNPENAFISFAEEESLFGSGFVYLAADHIEPRSEYGYSEWDKEGINPFGNHGEFAVPYVAFNGNTFRVPEELCLTQGTTDRLFDQLSAWMSRISPGVKLYASYSPFEERAKLDIRYEGQRLNSTPFLPVNVGFGIPYALPLVVALLTSSENGLLLIENPESHLHPKGQAAMAELIARAARHGTQIICESHSDHIINGIRVAVKTQTLPSKDLSIVYFDKDWDQSTKTVEISVDDNGNLSEYPEGLLDEWGILMSELL